MAMQTQLFRLCCFIHNNGIEVTGIEGFGNTTVHARFFCLRFFRRVIKGSRKINNPAATGNAGWFICVYDIKSVLRNLPIQGFSAVISYIKLSMSER